MKRIIAMNNLAKKKFAEKKVSDEEKKAKAAKKVKKAAATRRDNARVRESAANLVASAWSYPNDGKFGDGY